MRSVAHLGLPANLRGANKADLGLWSAAYPAFGSRVVPGAESGIQPADNGGQTMTPLQAAKAHCANYQPDGSCLGIYYNDDLSIDWQRYAPRPRCLLADCGQCSYFEEIILP